MSLTAPPVDPRAPLLPAVVILGNDAQLAARPATPVQLAHACLALGFRMAVPASWGDELIAAASLESVTARTLRPAIHCSCPHVARRVLAVGTELGPNLVSLVAPPVAASRYLRSHSPQGIRVTYVGRCPAAADDSIDARLTPEELLAQLAERGIDLMAQPEVFESVIPPDRRRHRSVPGGLPAADVLWSATQLRVETLRGEDIATEIAERVLERAPVLLDLAPAMGCVCSGALRGVPPEAARAEVAALEPPRSSLPVIERPTGLSLDLPIPAAARAVVDVGGESSERAAPLVSPDARLPARAVNAPTLDLPLGSRPGVPPTETHGRRPRLTPPGSAVIVPSMLAADLPRPAAPTSAPPPTQPFVARRRTGTGTARIVPGAVPVASDQEGRVLPRAYVGRRRVSRGELSTASHRLPEAAAGPVAMATEPGLVRPTHPEAPSTPDAPSGVETPDMERPIVHSVEPSPPPVPAAPVAATRSAASHPLRAAGTRAIERSRAVLATNPRASLIVALAAAVLLIGAAIGYAAARRGAGQSEVSGAGSGQLRMDSSAASAAPSLTAPRSAPSSTGTRPGPTARRAPATGRRRGGTAATGATSAGASTATGNAPIASAAPTPAPATATPVTPAPAPVDSAPAHARRDSLLALQRAESIAAEREALRREIERRRARIDSILRAQGGAPPTP